MLGKHQARQDKHKTSCMQDVCSDPKLEPIRYYVVLYVLLVSFRLAVPSLHGSAPNNGGMLHGSAPSTGGILHGSGQVGAHVYVLTSAEIESRWILLQRS